MPRGGTGHWEGARGAAPSPSSAPPSWTALPPGRWERCGGSRPPPDYSTGGFSL
ncbi:hypothetical protein HMPREF1550_01505 [Actinomyces sp. oral taxon 877 str. F0543]|nr:hypothetical protein HMPREF1550_01505 [Actinomyces sp. oral taxon 877 str. F0543]